MTGIRALHVIGGDDTGGAMSYLLPLLVALGRQGCKAHLLCLGGGGLAEAAAGRHLPHTVIPMSHSWDLRVLAPLRRFLSREDPHVVHTHGMRANIPVRLLVPGMRPRPILVTTVHSELVLDYANGVQAWAYGEMDRLTRRNVDGFCCVSADLARKLVAGGVPAPRVHVVHPGLESAEGGAITSARDARARRRASEGACPTAPPDRRPTIGTVARLVPVKDLGLLLEAVALTALSVPEVRAVIVGEGPERAALERRAAEADLAGRVQFLGRVVPARPLLEELDVYATTSESEGIPISVLEAMAAGLPVVATAVGGLRETVEEGVTGFLVKRKDERIAAASGIAARLVELLLDPGLRARQGAAGRALVAERFSPDAAASTTVAIYERALAAQSISEGWRQRRRA